VVWRFGPSVWESFRNDPDTPRARPWLTNLGGQMRTVATVPMPLVIFDRRIAILPLDPADSRAGAIEVHTLGVLAATYALFEQLWARGTAIGRPAPADGHGCNPQERALLTILAAGQTDEAAGRKLGLSLRTVRRMIVRPDGTPRCFQPLPGRRQRHQERAGCEQIGSDRIALDSGGAPHAH